MILPTTAGRAVGMMRWGGPRVTIHRRCAMQGRGIADLMPNVGNTSALLIS